jgi:hypothetical protein
MASHIKVEGAPVYDTAYLSTLEGLNPFPRDEYQELASYYVQGSPSRLQTMGYSELYERVVALRADGNSRAALVMLRLLRAYLVRVGGIGTHRLPWLPPVLASDDLTGDREVVDLTIDEEKEPEREVIDVDLDEESSDNDRPRKRLKKGGIRRVGELDQQAGEDGEEENESKEGDLLVTEEGLHELLQREEELAALVAMLRAQEDAAMVPGEAPTDEMVEANSLGPPVMLKFRVEDAMLPADLRTGTGRRWQGRIASRWYTNHAKETSGLY